MLEGESNQGGDAVVLYAIPSMLQVSYPIGTGGWPTSDQYSWGGPCLEFQTWETAILNLHSSFGRWPRSQTGVYSIEGAPGPLHLGTGEERPNCQWRIHAGSYWPFWCAAPSDSVSTTPHMPIGSGRQLDQFQSSGFHPRSPNARDRGHPQLWFG